MGFTLHNITEGIGIAAPLLKTRPPLISFVGLALLAGAPAILGMWLGSLAISPQWSAVALAVGAGAILQVIIEVAAYLVRTSGGEIRSLVSPTVIGGIALGITVMYITGMFVKVWVSARDHRNRLINSGGVAGVIHDPRAFNALSPNV